MYEEGVEINRACSLLRSTVIAENYCYVHTVVYSRAYNKPSDLLRRLRKALATIRTLATRRLA